MNFVTLPQGLFVFYGALVLACGIGLGVIVGRNWRHRDAAAPPPDELLRRRMDQLEEGLDLTDAAMEALVDQRGQADRVRSPRARVVAA